MSSAKLPVRSRHCILVAFRELHFKTSLRLPLFLSRCLPLAGRGERVVKPERGQSFTEDFPRILPSFYSLFYFFFRRFSFSFFLSFFRTFDREKLSSLSDELMKDWSHNHAIEGEEVSLYAWAWKRWEKPRILPRSRHARPLCLCPLIFVRRISPQAGHGLERKRHGPVTNLPSSNHGETWKLEASNDFPSRGKTRQVPSFSRRFWLGLLSLVRGDWVTVTSSRVKIVVCVECRAVRARAGPATGITSRLPYASSCVSASSLPRDWLN